MCGVNAQAQGFEWFEKVARKDARPQRIALACSAAGARLIHYSSDGVFSGARGGYRESDAPDASDAYGIGKLLVELRDPHTISIRTSMIGHELRGRAGLLEWFLEQEDSCRCYARAVFSGLPTTEHARIIRDFIIPSRALSGVYHVAARPISKLALLALVADVYGKRISLEADDRVVIDRSLDGSRFREACGYSPPGWPELIRAMHAEYETRPPRAR
jgi:dTDP-4-dehydrorhamnose reductase